MDRQDHQFGGIERIINHTLAHKSLEVMNRYSLKQAFYKYDSLVTLETHEPISNRYKKKENNVVKNNKLHVCKTNMKTMIKNHLLVNLSCCLT